MKAQLVTIKGRPGFMDIPEQPDHPGLKFDYGIMICPDDMTVTDTDDPDVVTVSFKASREFQKMLSPANILEPAEYYVDTNINPPALKEIVEWAAAITLSYFIFTAEQITGINKALAAKFKNYKL